MTAEREMTFPVIDKEQRVTGAGQPDPAKAIFRGFSRALHNESPAWRSFQGHWEEDFDPGCLLEQLLSPPLPMGQNWHED